MPPLGWTVLFAADPMNLPNSIFQALPVRKTFPQPIIEEAPNLIFQMPLDFWVYMGVFMVVEESHV